MRLLIAEDDPKLLKSLLHIFQRSKFSADGVSDGAEALVHGRTREYDGLVLDIMMPGMDGLQVLQTLRGEAISTPALFLTARTEVSQCVEGLDCGADDYLPKPFSTAELLARVRAMLRRKDTYLPDLLTLGAVTLNRSTYQLLYQGRDQALSGKEFQLLEMMMQASGSIIPTERFITHLWGWDTNVDTSVGLGAHLQPAQKDYRPRRAARDPLCPQCRLCAGGQSMIFTLRKKFILINAVSVLLVFTGIFLFQAVSGVMQMNRILDTLTDAIASNNGVFPAFQPSGRSPLSDWLAYEDVITEETRFSTRFFTVRLDENGQVTEMNMDAVSAISEEEVADYAARAAAEGDERGWVSDYRYKAVPGETGTMFVFVNGNMQQNLTFRQLFTAFLVLLGSALLILMLTVLISRRAVRPVAESYEKQKQFITDANHELKTPLTLILSNLDIVESEVGKTNGWRTSAARASV